MEENDFEQKMQFGCGLGIVSIIMAITLGLIFGINAFMVTLVLIGLASLMVIDY